MQQEPCFYSGNSIITECFSIVFHSVVNELQFQPSSQCPGEKHNNAHRVHWPSTSNAFSDGRLFLCHFWFCFCDECMSTTSIPGKPVSVKPLARPSEFQAIPRILRIHFRTNLRGFCIQSFCVNYSSSITPDTRH